MGRVGSARILNWRLASRILSRLLVVLASGRRLEGGAFL